jgi:hypothetical protein
VLSEFTDEQLDTLSALIASLLENEDQSATVEASAIN